MHSLYIEPLSRPAFAPYGDVIGADMAIEGVPINGGTSTKFASEPLALDTAQGKGSALLYRARGQSLPLMLQELERHRLGSHAISIHAGTWHHGLIAAQDGDFVVIERVATPVDCDMHKLTQSIELKPWAL